MVMLIVFIARACHSIALLFHPLTFSLFFRVFSHSNLILRIQWLNLNSSEPFLSNFIHFIHELIFFGFDVTSIWVNLINCCINSALSHLAALRFEYIQFSNLFSIFFHKFNNSNLWSYLGLFIRFPAKFVHDLVSFNFEHRLRDC